ncbi:hypothetical protein CLOM_g20508 [Closterium sp. NIES-68]|nr:hypothetical protein CLOM_g20508 [Closterium sp. NIES-68]GJP58303.1 hypothetical protein CLOP_g23185 [Closterium sp. NIES-67]
MEACSAVQACSASLAPWRGQQVSSASKIELTTSFLSSYAPSRSHGHMAARKAASKARRVVSPCAKVREIFMPALSSTMTEGKIVAWSKSEGDQLSKGESVVVVESDKADMDVETFYDGILAVILVDEGEVAAVGSAIAVLAESEDELDAAKAAAAKLKGSSAPAAAAPAAAAPVEASAPPPPPPPPPAPAAPAPAVAAPVVSQHPAAEGGRIVATPYAKKLAKELKVNLATVRGSGPLGRIVAADVEAAAAAPAAVAAAPVAAPAAAAAAPAAAAAGPAVVPGSTVAFSGMQAAVARNMEASLAVPTFRVGYTITTDALDALYKQIKGKGVTMTALLAKAVAMALAQHPTVNASCRDGGSFVFAPSINVCVAVAMDGGLITPVLQDTDKMDIYTLSNKWRELVQKAREKRLSPAEYQTGTFTLSNLGMYGVDRFDAILPPGQGAIMAVGASRPKVVALPNGMFAVRRQMQVNVTADHRIIYGADLAAFLQTLAQIIENPKDLTF